MTTELRERIAKAIWARRPDCAGKPWPLTDDYSRRAYKHNPIAAVDLCYLYADAALAVLGEGDSGWPLSLRSPADDGIDAARADDAERNRL